MGLLCGVGLQHLDPRLILYVIASLDSTLVGQRRLRQVVTLANLNRPSERSVSPAEAHRAH